CVVSVPLCSLYISSRCFLLLAATLAVTSSLIFLQSSIDNQDLHSFPTRRSSDLFAGEKQIINEWKTHAEIPTSNSLSTTLAKDLKRRGFSFVGPVICYAYLQAIGIIQDHTAECFLYKRK